MLSIMKTNNKNIKSADYKRRKVEEEEEEEEWGSLDPGRHSTRLSLYLLASFSLYGGLGFLAVKRMNIYVLHLNLHLTIRNLQKTLIFVVLDRDQ